MKYIRYKWFKVIALKNKKEEINHPFIMISKAKNIIDIVELVDLKTKTMVNMLITDIKQHFNTVKILKSFEAVDQYVKNYKSP